MRVFLYKKPGDERIVLQARAEGPVTATGRKALGDYVRILRPGDTIWGWSYDEILKLGNCQVDLQPKPGWEAPAPQPTDRGETKESKSAG